MATTTTTTETTTTREIIQAAYDREAAIVKVGLAIRNWLSANEGKKLTKRNKPDLIAAATEAWDGPEIRVWPGILGLEISSENYRRNGCREGFSYRLGEGKCPIVSLDYFDNHNTWFAAAIGERQPRRLEDLASSKPEEIDALVDAYVKARETLKQALDGLEESYTVRRKLGCRRYQGLEIEIY